jgi:hypothetical protein
MAIIQKDDKIQADNGKKKSAAFYEALTGKASVN